MSIRHLTEFYQFVWMLQSNYQQSLAWQDAAEARTARARAEARADAQLQAMMAANPSGALGHAKLNDDDALIRSGLL